MGAPIQNQNVVSSSTSIAETKADLVTLAGKANPVLKFYDPIGLSDERFWDTTEEETIGFLREAEIKHGRIAMFAFVDTLFMLTESPGHGLCKWMELLSQRFLLLLKLGILSLMKLNCKSLDLLVSLNSTVKLHVINIT